MSSSSSRRLLAGLATFAVLLAVGTVGTVGTVGSALARRAGSIEGTSVAGHSPIAPELRRELRAAPADPVHAIVVLDSQAQLTGITGTRAERLATIEHRLRQHASRTQQDLRSYLGREQASGQVTGVQPLWVSNEIGVTATAAVIRKLAARPDVLAVRADSALRAPSPIGAEGLATGVVEPNVSLVHAPDLWSLGLRGQHIIVASLDTGVDLTHPDLAGSWRGGANSWFDPNGEHPTTPVDVSGHGTQTMGVMVGGDAGGSSIGVAPDAQWIAAKIFNDRGIATTVGIHLAFQWLLDPDGNPATADAPNVVNNSWSGSGGGCDTEFEPDLTSLRVGGILPVFAAGNDGPSAATIFSPANLPEAFAVGGTDNAYATDPSSSRGPSACGTAIAPRLAAPGVSIHTSDLFGGYVDDTGTSVAAPHVAGGLALLLSAFPGMTADRQQAALDAGALDLGPAGWDPDTGYGALDLAASYQWLLGAPDLTVSVSPSSQSTLAGTTASYNVTTSALNGFASDVSLSLSGLTSGQASWGFTPALIVGGSGTSRLDLTPVPGLAAGSYPLTVTATSASLIRTSAVTLTVTAPPPPPDFTLTASPSSATAAPGGTAAYAVSVAGASGFGGSVGLSVAGLPASVGTATFVPGAVGAGGTSTLTVRINAAAATGTYPLVVTGVSGSLSHTANVSLVVAKDFTLTATPATVTVKHGKTAAYTVSVAPVGGLTGKIAVSASGAPSGSTTTFSRVNVPLPGTSTFKVHTSAATARGTFTITITGTKGVLTHTVTVAVTVT